MTQHTAHQANDGRTQQETRAHGAARKAGLITLASVTAVMAVGLVQLRSAVRSSTDERQASVQKVLEDNPGQVASTLDLGTRTLKVSGDAQQTLCLQAALMRAQETGGLIPARGESQVIEVAGFGKVFAARVISLRSDLKTAPGTWPQPMGCPLDLRLGATR